MGNKYIKYLLLSIKNNHANWTMLPGAHTGYLRATFTSKQGDRVIIFEDGHCRILKPTMQPLITWRKELAKAAFDSWKKLDN